MYDLKKKLVEIFKIKNLGELVQFLSIELDRSFDWAARLQQPDLITISYRLVR